MNRAFALVVCVAVLDIDPHTHHVLAFPRPADLEDNAVEERRLDGHAGPVNMAAFSPDRETIASVGEDGSVRLWSLKTGKALATLGGHRGGILFVSYAPDGKTLATSGRDATVILWDPIKGEKPPP